MKLSQLIEIIENKFSHKNWWKILRRSFREGSVQLWRNKFLSFSTIGLGALILILLNFIFSLQYFADSSLRKFEARTDFSIPLRVDFDPFEYDALKNALKPFDIKWEVLSAQEMGEFSLPPRMHVQFQDITQVGEVFKIFKNARYTEVISAWDGKGEQEFVRLVDRLLSLRQGVTSAAQFLVLVFLVGGILLMINTFRLVIFSRRNEIFIARLVGADPGFVTGPFLMEGALLGFFSAFASIVLFTFILREVEMLPSGEIFLHLWNKIFLWELLASGGVGVLGAWIATRKYLFGKFDE